MITDGDDADEHENEAQYLEYLRNRVCNFFKKLICLQSHQSVHRALAITTRKTRMIGAKRSARVRTCVGKTS